MRPLLILVLLFTSSYVSAQTVRIVDHNFNAPTGANVYATLQAAVDAAVPGDIIQVQPSATAYGSVTIDKTLTLKGIGFNLTKEIPYLSTVGDITLTRDAASAENASGSVITGLIINQINLGTQNGAAYTLSDVTIHNCRISYFNGQSGGVPLNNLLIYNNDIVGWGIFYNVITGDSWFRNNVVRGNFLQFLSATPSTITITNNILYCYIYIVAATTSIPILNNNFIGASPSTYSFGLINEKIISNNIFYGRTPAANAAGTASTNLKNGIFTNNLSFNTGNDALAPADSTLGNTGSPNLVSVSPNFTSVPVSSTWSVTHDFSLQAGSAAINAGSDGTNIGITGGAYPWIEPNLILKTTEGPTIEILNTSTVINPSDPLPVRVKAKSN